MAYRFIRDCEDVMNFARLVTAIQKFARPGRDETGNGLLPHEQMRRLLERERARVFRTGESLSVVTFTPRGPEFDPVTAPLLTAILRDRLRTTDEVGHLDSRQIGVVLPATPAAGAWKLADDVCLEFPKDVPPPICAVYSYPLNEGAANGLYESGVNGSAAQAERNTLGLELLFLQALPVWKRALDVGLAAVGLAASLPVLGTVAAAIKLASPGPVFFRQQRSGWGGRPFVIYKFRTMIVNAEARKAELRALNEQDGPAFKVRQDPRITTIGRFLRCTSLDELPQLWNILKGDMSLVGPRPLPIDETEACDGWHLQRLDVVPGLTGIWQVRGRSTVSFAEWVRMDLQYIRSRSLWQDLKLLVLTVPAVALRKGAH